MVAATFAGIYSGTMEAVGDRVLNRTLEALNRARGKKATDAKRALEETKKDPHNDAVIDALAAAFVALARSNPQFSTQMQADYKQLPASWVTIHAEAGSNVIVNAPGMHATQDVDEGGSDSSEEDKKFELSESLKRAPSQIWRVANTPSRCFEVRALARVPDRFKDTGFKLAVVRGLIWLPRIMMIAITIVVVTPFMLFVNAGREKDAQSFVAGVVASLAVLLLIVVPLASAFSGGAAAASTNATCELRDTTHGSGEVVGWDIASYENYDVTLNTTIGPIVLSIDAQDHPCEAFAFHEAVTNHKYRNVPCDGVSYGVVSCWPDVISNQAKIFRVATDGKIPSSDSYPSEDTVLLKIDGDEAGESNWVTGLLAFVGEGDSSYTMSDNVVEIGTVVSGTNALEAAIESGSHHEDADFWKPSKLNKPFRITSMAVVAPDPNAEPSSPTASPSAGAS